MALRTVFATALVALALTGQALAAQPTPDGVKVAQGALHGAVSGPVASFKNIPFAAPPTGPLRWRPPAPAKPWKGVREATAYGPTCMQLGREVAAGSQSEDCLTLNVWKPADAVPGQKLPVMVWIHGGAFTGGSGSSAFYDGSEFARRGIVLVTVNYRLGRLGFFAHPALTAESPKGPLGNYGLMDNLAALQWVRKNIAAFGGDPAQVTVFGESAGGMAVNDLMAMPAAKGLFVRAISQSGFGRTNPAPIRGDATRTGEKAGLAFAKTQAITGTGPDALKALRALSAEQLSARAADGAATLGGTAPMIDGVLLTESPTEAFAKGHELKVPYIAGGNSFEASLFSDYLKAPELVLRQAGPLRDKVLAAYGGTVATAAADLATETQIIEPNRHLARLHVKNGQKAWVYYMAYLPAAQRGLVPGVAHGGEIGYVFGTLSDKPTTRGGRTIPAATPQDRQVSNAMTGYWTAFARGGDPAAGGGPAWPAYDPASEAVLAFANDGVQVQSKFHQASLDLAEQIATAGAGR